MSATVTLQRRMLAWFKRSRRDLPWRRTRDPYRIWVSEVMLQQTQVATAKPYYESFVERFPTVADLAAASEDDVLEAWSGLGYYRRARHLRDAARLVVGEHGGRVPNDEVTFGALPGVGRYTRGAVLSIAFGTPLPVLDGNVARVLARLFALPHGIRDPRGAKALWDLATTLVPRDAAGDWNQSLMELGATVCTPRAPRCVECPVRGLCRAFAGGRPERYPPASKRAVTRHVRRAVARVVRNGRWLVTRRTGAVLAGLWEPPGIELAMTSRRAGGRVVGRALRPSEHTRSAAPAALADRLAELGVRATLAPTGVTIRHRITDRAIEVEVWDACEVGRAKPLAAVEHATTRWVDLEDPGVPLTGLARRLARLATRGHSPG